MLMGLLHVNSVSGPLGRANARRIGDVVPFFTFQGAELHALNLM